MQSGKVRYNSREDTLLSLCIPMEAVLNKGGSLFSRTIILIVVPFHCIPIAKMEASVSGVKFTFSFNL